MKRSSALAFLTAVIGAVSVMHCSFLTSLDGLTSGDASASDGSVEATTMVDAGSDANADSGARDAAPDANPFCLDKTAAVFCADFDEDGSLVSGWSGTFSDDGGSSTLDNDGATSAPFAYLATTGPVATASETHQSYLYRNLTNIPQRVIATFDMRVEHFSSNNISAEATSLYVSGAIPNTGYSIQLNVGESGSRVTEQIPLDAGVSTAVDHPFTTSLALGVWSHVVIDAVFSGGPRTVTVTLDGKIVLDHAALSANSNPGPLRFLLGVLYDKGPTDGFSARFDNVTLETP